jgi:hypothetical protein
MEIKQLNTTLDGHSFLLSNLYITDGDKRAVRLLFEGYDSGNIFGSTIYHAMQNLHKELDKKGAKLMCSCFRLNIRPSNMSIDMGGGIMAYEHKIGEHPTEMVNIFDEEKDPGTIVSYEEQNAYYLSWLESIK